MQEMKRKSESLQAAYPKSVKRARTHNQDSFHQQERTLLATHVTPEDPQGYRWVLTFWSSLPSDEYRSGFAACVALDEECPAILGHQGNNNNSNNDNTINNKEEDDDNEPDEPWCDVIGILEFGEEKLKLDFTHRFSRKNNKVPLFVFWSSVNGVHPGSKKKAEQPALPSALEVSLDVRRVQHVLPYQ